MHIGVTKAEDTRRDNVVGDWGRVLNSSKHTEFHPVKIYVN